jgi:hypothetical protein
VRTKFAVEMGMNAYKRATGFITFNKTDRFEEDEDFVTPHSDELKAEQANSMIGNLDTDIQRMGDKIEIPEAEQKKLGETG